MIRKITSFALLTFLSLGQNVFGQVTLQSVNLPVPGDLWSNKTITDTTIQPGPSGANQNWNFSNFFVLPTVISEQYSTPTGAGNDALFPSANLKVNSFFGGDDYYIKSSTELQYLGTKSNTNEIFITNIQRILTVPMSFGDSIVNAPVTGTGFGYPLSGTVAVKADGTGSLSLNTGAFTNTLRVFTDMNLVLGAGTGVDTYIHLQRYSWYTSSYRAPVFQISILDVSGPLGNTHQKVTTVSLLTTDVEEQSSDIFNFSLTPNPAGSRMAVNLNVKIPSPVELTLSDLTGRICNSQSLFPGSGMNKIDFDLSDLPKGIYLVNVKSGSVSRSQRLVID